MNRRTFVIAVAAGLTCNLTLSTRASAEALSANQLADQMQKFYDQTHTFQASFKQRYWVEAYRKTKDSNGLVTFAKPGQMSWRYKNNGNRVVSDGKTIKIYEADNKQMYLQPVGNSQYPAALSFLVGGGNLKNTFMLKMLDAKAMGFEGGHVMMGVPKSPTPAYQKVFFYVDAKTFQVRRVLMLDAQRNRNRFDFVTPVVNKTIDKTEFNFTPPAGTRIIKP
ncbi:MAG TPA: outer membrane lipoprotein carrier protein LolA [Polyangiaceae bacterium]